MESKNIPNITLLVPFDAIAGSQRMAVAVNRALTAAGCQVNIRLGFGSNGLISSDLGVRPFLNINVISLRKILYPLWILWEMIRNGARVTGGHLVWANTIHAAPATLIALLARPQSVIIHLHEVDFPWIFRRFLTFADRRGALLLCVSRFHRESLRLNALVIPNCSGVEGPRVADAANDRSRLLFVGNTSKEKGFDLFIAVCRELRGSDLRCTAFLPNLESSNPALCKQAIAAGIEVRYGVTDARKIYSDGAFLMQCTDSARWTETFSLVAAESVTCLVPVVCAGATVIHEIAGPALAFDDPTRNPRVIANRIKSLLANREEYNELINACDTQRREYSWDAFGGRIDQLVRKLSIQQ